MPETTVHYLMTKTGDDEQHFYVGGKVTPLDGDGSEWFVVRFDGDRILEALQPESGTLSEFWLEELRVLEIPGDIRSNSFNQGYVAPYHVRDFEDDSYANVYSTFEEAAHYARWLADGEDQPMQVCNGYSNAVEAFDPSEEEEEVNGDSIREVPEHQ